jgi:hypothetical protein
VVGANIDNDTDYANAVYMENISRYAMTELDAYNLVGNHCKSNSTQKIYDLIGKYNSFDNYGTTQIRGFGYKDYSDKKVRVICLNTCDYWNTQGGNGMSYEQKDFFMKALDLSSKSNYSSWTIIVLSHIPLDYLGGDYNKGADLKAILKAYDSGTSVSIAVNSGYASAQNESSKYSGTITYNYSGKNAPRVINIHGHVHTNVYGKLTFIDDNTELDIIRIATPNSSFSGNASTDRYTEYGKYSITTTEAAKIKKVANSKADTSATFYFIDLGNQVVYSIGYGADIDRTIVYKSATIYSVSYNLTNVTSSNSSTGVVEGNSFVATLSIGSAYVFESVTITMGGVDITSTVYSNGVINIAKVTGNIVITAKAKTSYTNIIDTVGTEDNLRLRSGGNTGSAAGFVSGYFTVKAGDIIRVYFPNGNRASIPSNGIYCALYTSDKSTLAGTYDGSSSSSVLKNATDTGYEIHIPSTVTCNWARVAGGPNGAYTGWVVTVNEEIKK